MIVKTGKTRRILCVDDDPTILSLEDNILRREGFEVITAPDGYAALTLLKDQEFDLILLDLMMPGMDGFKVAQAIRQIKKDKKVPVVFVTARDDSEAMKMGFQAGGSIFVTKPFTAKQLTQVVRSMIH